MADKEILERMLSRLLQELQDIYTLRDLQDLHAKETI